MGKRICGKALPVLGNADIFKKKKISVCVSQVEEFENTSPAIQSLWRN
jgi:hypothetical protein